MASQTAADIEPIPARNHDVEEKQRRRLTLGVGNKVGGSAENANTEAGGFQVMLHQAGDICVVFKNKYCLAQPFVPHPCICCGQVATGPRLSEDMHDCLQPISTGQRECKSTVNLIRWNPASMGRRSTP